MYLGTPSPVQTGGVTEFDLRHVWLELEVWGLGFGVWGLGLGAWGLGFGVWGLAFGVWVLRFAAH